MDSSSAAEEGTSPLRPLPRVLGAPGTVAGAQALPRGAAPLRRSVGATGVAAMRLAASTAVPLSQRPSVGQLAVRPPDEFWSTWRPPESQILQRVVTGDPAWDQLVRTRQMEEVAARRRVGPERMIRRGLPSTIRRFGATRAGADTAPGRGGFRMKPEPVQVAGPATSASGSRPRATRSQGGGRSGPGGRGSRARPAGGPAPSRSPQGGPVAAGPVGSGPERSAGAGTPARGAGSAAGGAPAIRSAPASAGGDQHPPGRPSGVSGRGEQVARLAREAGSSVRRVLRRRTGASEPGPAGDPARRGPASTLPGARGQTAPVSSPSPSSPSPAVPASASGPAGAPTDRVAAAPTERASAAAATGPAPTAPTGGPEPEPGDRRRTPVRSPSGGLPMVSLRAHESFIPGSAFVMRSTRPPAPSWIHRLPAVNPRASQHHATRPPGPSGSRVAPGPTAPSGAASTPSFSRGAPVSPAAAVSRRESASGGVSDSERAAASRAPAAPGRRRSGRAPSLDSRSGGVLRSIVGAGAAPVPAATRPASGTSGPGDVRSLSGPRPLGGPAGRHDRRVGPPARPHTATLVQRLHAAASDRATARRERITQDEARLAHRFESARSGGRASRSRPLPPRFAPLVRSIGGGDDISMVTGASTRRALAAVGAPAATVGRTVHLARPPDRSARSAAIVSHELVHAAAPAPVARFYGGADTPEERRAEQVARIMARAPVGSSPPGRRDAPAGAPAQRGAAGPTSARLPAAGDLIRRQTRGPVAPGTAGLAVGGVAGFRRVTEASRNGPPSGRQTQEPRSPSPSGAPLGGSRSEGRAADGDRTIRRSPAPPRARTDRPAARGPAPPGRAAGATAGGTLAGSAVPAVQRRESAGSLEISSVGVEGEGRQMTTTEMLDQIQWIVQVVEDRILAEIDRRGLRHREWF